MSLVDIANETVSIVERGVYTSPMGAVVSIADEVRAALEGTVLHRPGDDLKIPPPSQTSTTIEVWADTTAGAARRLCEAGETSVSILNFASAKNPGGGFLRGAKAQEEDLARCSAIYHCIKNERDFYDANRAEPTTLYTDHIIFSPKVPFFRDEHLNLLDHPFCVGVVTSPAPNAGGFLRHFPTGHALIYKTLARRAHRVLQVFAHHRQRVLVLGAWGCGVFGNNPEDVAELFAARLGSEEFAGAFSRVVFAIHDRSQDRTILRAFERAMAIV